MADKSEKKKETTNKSAKKTLTKKSEKLTPAKDTAPKQVNVDRSRYNPAFIQVNSKYLHLTTKRYWRFVVTPRSL